jgi:energy-coupling factor transport system ATP-binding protein
VISFDRVGVRYADAVAPVLADVTLKLDEGELCLVIGHTGSGKSTLLGAINGLVPHFTGGTLSGRVTIGGRDTASGRPRELADLVGLVGQDPLAGFVTDTVQDELAYTMEQLAVPSAAMRTRL